MIVALGAFQLLVILVDPGPDRRRSPEIQGRAHDLPQAPRWNGCFVDLQELVRIDHENMAADRGISTTA